MVMPADPALYRELTEMLAAAEIPDAALEARWILEDAANEADAKRIAQRRAAHEPLQYLLGAWEFYGRRFAVGPGVLIPRADTETLADAVLQRLPKSRPLHAADLCTGSGCIAVTLAAERPGLHITAADNSPAALSYARRNIALHSADVTLLEADVLDAETAAPFAGMLDAIVCNPPYLTAEDMQTLQPEVRFEPAAALDGGEDGLHFYRQITAVWRSTLKPGGLLAYEVGIGQADSAAEILMQNGFAQIGKIRDLNGVERVVLGTRRYAENE